jgi:hypothetical protein
MLIRDTLELISPNGGEYLWNGKVSTIKWNPPVNAVSFDLAYSLDNGTTWLRIASGLSGNSYNWYVPAPGKRMQGCYVKITAYNMSKSKVGEDKSDRKFTIIR